MSEQPDFQAVTEIQQKIWSAGDFAMIAHHRHAGLREPRRGRRHVAPGAGSRRCLRQRQCGDRRRAPHLGRRHRARLRSQPARERARAGRRRTDGDRVRRGRRPAASLRGRQLRHRALGLRGDVRSRPGEGRRRAAPRLQAGRQDRDGQLDPGRLRRRLVQDHRQARTAAPGSDPPLAWGTEERVRELFGDGISDLRCERRIFRQPFESVDHCIEFFRDYFGPTKMAFERVGEEGAAALEGDCRKMIEKHDIGGDRAMIARGRVPGGCRYARLGRAASRAAARAPAGRRR